jgi:hypothetical protein
MKKNVFLLNVLSLSLTSVIAQTMVTGPSSSKTPYLIPSLPNHTITAVLTVSDAVNGYNLCGILDGAGAYDNGNGTFTLLMNHEFGTTTGIARAHGQPGAFVSKWVINKNNLSVVSGSDLIQTVNLWNGTSYIPYTSANSTTLSAFGRFCSADLPAVSAYFNSTTNLGTQDRIFMNGEESGAEGRAFGHISTGASAGTSYELPHLGKASWENAVANPNSGNKTVVGLLDDATPGQVYFYIGTKTNTGTPVDRAGLTNGKLYGVSVTGMVAETSTAIPTANTTFTLIDLGNVSAITGSSLNTLSNNVGVTSFLRPEDGAWDPSSPNDFYFVTTNSFSSPSRMWKLSFTNGANPELGGTITAVLDGTEGQKMMDNLGINTLGQIFIQEDPGNQTHIAKMWRYDIATDALTQIAEHDPARFITGGVSFLTQDEESSGMIDMSSILGPNTYLFVDQAHYSIPGELAEGGQILVMKVNPSTVGLPKINSLVSAVKIFPNPTNDEVNVSFSLANVERVTVNIYDIAGKLMSSVNEEMEVGDQTLTINTSSYKNGTYFVEVKTKTETVSTLKLAIAH